MVVITPTRRFDGTHSYPPQTEGLMTTRLHIANDFQYPLFIQKKVASGWKNMGMMGTSERLYQWAPDGEVWRLWDPKTNNTLASVETSGSNAVLVAAMSEMPLSSQYMWRHNM